mgnify:CR=1 FL=1
MTNLFYSLIDGKLASRMPRNYTKIHDHAFLRSIWEALQLAMLESPHDQAQVILGHTILKVTSIMTLRLTTLASSSTLLLIIPKFLTTPTQHSPPISLVHTSLAILMVFGQPQLISNPLQLPPHQWTSLPFFHYHTHFTTYSGPVTSIYPPKD